MVKQVAWAWKGQVVVVVAGVVDVTVEVPVAIWEQAEEILEAGQEVMEEGVAMGLAVAHLVRPAGMGGAGVANATRLARPVVEVDALKPEALKEADVEIASRNWIPALVNMPVAVAFITSRLRCRLP